jgi:hypothetical protein
MSLSDLITQFTDTFGNLQTWLFEAAVQPLVYQLGMGNFSEDAYNATGWLLVGLIQGRWSAGARWKPAHPGAACSPMWPTP